MTSHRLHRPIIAEEHKKEGMNNYFKEAALEEIGEEPDEKYFKLIF